MRLVNYPKMYDAESEALSPSWDQIQAGAELIINNLSELEFDKIVVVVRGGMVLSIIISHRLGIKNIDFYQVSRNSSDKPRSYSSVKIKKYPVIKKGEKILVVEDIVYKGESINSLIKKINTLGASTVAVCSLFMDEGFESDYLNKVGDNKINYIAAYKCRADKWIRFPWENKIKGEKIGKYS